MMQSQTRLVKQFEKEIEKLEDEMNALFFMLSTHSFFHSRNNELYCPLMDLSGAIILGLSLGLIMAISVGPTLFAIIRYSLSHNYRAGIAFVLGVSLSDILYVTLANMATPWLQWFHQYEKPLYYLASALLLLIGSIGFFKKQIPKRPATRIVKLNNREYLGIWSSGFLLNTLNPALILQWITATAVTAAKPAFYRFVFFSCCLGLVLAVDVLKVLLADSISKRLTLRKIMYLQKFSALCLFLFGIGIFVVTFLNR
jgi:threonine/homoserine/homoserine lactone efflux protein